MNYRKVAVAVVAAAVAEMNEEELLFIICGSATSKIDILSRFG